MPSEIVSIADPTSGSSARVLVSLGFNCFSWQPTLDDGPREMLWAHPDFASRAERPSGSGIPLLFPFPGRIGGAKYLFAGREYELEPGDAYGNAIHGFAMSRPWRIVEQTAARIVGEFQASRDDASILARWPSDFRIRVSYEVRGRELVSGIRYENTGDGTLPCGFGTHTYFRLPLVEGSAVADTIVTVPAAKRWETNQMLPTGRKVALDDWAELPRGLRLGEHQFDSCLTGLKADADELIRTRLTEPKSGRTVTQSFEKMYTQCVVYTPPHREAICAEPYTCLTDPFRMTAEGNDTGWQILEPLQSRESTITIDVSG